MFAGLGKQKGTRGMSNTDNNALDAIIAKLRDLLTWPDGWNSYDALAPDPDAVSRAEQWITEFYQRIIDTQQQWITPNITATANGDVILSWRRGQRDLEVYIEKQDMFYIIIEGKGTDAKITDGDINTIEDMQQLWQWLLEITQDEE